MERTFSTLTEIGYFGANKPASPRMPDGDTPAPGEAEMRRLAHPSNPFRPLVCRGADGAALGAAAGEPNQERPHGHLDPFPPTRSGFI